MVNVSSMILSESQQSVLTKGLNFAPTPKKCDIPSVITSVEEALRRCELNSETSGLVRSRVVGALRKPFSASSNLTPAELSALKQLRADTSIVILSADKGQTTVVMDRDEYDDRLLSMLQDTATYNELNRDPATHKNEFTSPLIETTG